MFVYDPAKRMAWATREVRRDVGRRKERKSGSANASDERRDWRMRVIRQGGRRLLVGTPQNDKDEQARTRRTRETRPGIANATSVSAALRSADNDEKNELQQDRII